MKTPIVMLCLALTASAIAAPAPAPNPMSGRTVAQLAKILRSDAPEMDRANAALALVEIVTPPATTKGKKDKKAPEWELKVPKGFVDTCMIGLVDRASAVRFYSGQALAAVGTEAVPALTKAVASDSDDVKISAIHAVGMMARKIGGKKGGADVDLTPVFGKAIPALRKALKDDNYIVRETACATFSRLGAAGGPAIDDLVARLGDEQFCVVNRAVHAVAAADPSGAKSVPALVATLKSKHDVREFIAKELAGMGQAAKGAVPALSELAGADKNSWHVALASAKALLTIVTYDEKPKQDAVVAERKVAIGAIAGAIAKQDAKFLQARLRNVLFTHTGYCPIGSEIEPLMPWLVETLRQWAASEPGYYPPPRAELCLLLANVGQRYRTDYLVALAKELKAAKDTKEGCLKDLKPILDLEGK